MASHASQAPPPPVNNRRKDLRIQILGQLYGHVVALDVPLAVKNLSAGGFAVDSPLPFEAGASHQFRFTTDDGRAVSIGAQAVHCLRIRTPEGGTRYLAGFEFTRPADDQEADEAIETLLDSALSVLTFR